MKYNRILIIGPSGAGKTTLSEYMSIKLGIPVIHLDKEYWLPNWERRDLASWKEIINTFVLKDSWIIEGNYYQTLDERLKRCDLVIYLRPNPYLCVSSIRKRVYLTKTKKIDRIDLAKGCLENKVDKNLTKWSFNYNKQYAPIIDNIMAKYSNVKVVTFKNRKDAYKFVDDLKDNK